MYMGKKQEYSGYFLPFFAPVTMDFDMLFRHYFDFIVRNIFQIFKFENIPESVNEAFFKYCLFCNGKSTFFRLDSGEIVALNGVYSDEPDLYYIPKKMLVTNPALKKSYLLERDTECVVVYCSETDIYNQMDRYGGLYPLICRTATMLADSDLSINVSQKNKRLINVIAAEDQSTKESIDIVVKKQYSGEPYAVVMKSLIDNVQSVPITDNTGGSQDILQLIKAHQYILAHFYEALGLQTHDNMKQERLITAEINDNENLAKLNINDILCTIQDGLNRVNAMFGTEISVHLNPLLEEPEKSKSDAESEAEPEEPEESKSDAESEAEPEEPEESKSDAESEAELEEPKKSKSDAESEAELKEQDADAWKNWRAIAAQYPGAMDNPLTAAIINVNDESSVEINIDTGGDDNADNTRVPRMGNNT